MAPAQMTQRSTTACCRSSRVQASIPAAVLVCVGGVLYITGAVFYALKKPNFSYHHFGFHELFHALTVLAFTAHFVAIALAVLA